MDSENFGGRNQGIACALAWVTVARDSDSDYPFYTLGQFHRICAGHLWCQIGSTLTKLSLSVSCGSYCTSAIVGSRVYGYPLATLYITQYITHILLTYITYILLNIYTILTIPLCGQCKVKWFEPEYCLCFGVGYYGTWL